MIIDQFGKSDLLWQLIMKPHPIFSATINIVLHVLWNLYLICFCSSGLEHQEPAYFTIWALGYESFFSSIFYLLLGQIVDNVL